MPTNPKAQVSAVHRTFNSSLIYGCEMAIGIVVVLCTSIPLARVIGPDRLGYFTFIQWMAMIGGNVVQLGIPSTARRYMTEAIGRDDMPMARGVFFSTLRLQALLAVGMVVVGEVIVFTLTDRAYWGSSWLMVIGLVPRMIMSIPSQANTASVRLQNNLVAYIASCIVLIGVLNFGLWAGWDLVGAAIAFVVSYCVELAVKMVLVLRWMGWGPRAAIGAELRRRMFTFSKHSTAIMLINIVVWDKSDFFFLKLLHSDRAALAFFGTAFSLADRVVQLVQVFAGGLSVTLMAELGRSKEKMYVIAKSGLRYALLVASALLFGLAAIAPQVVLTLYGPRFAPAGALLSIAATMAIGKCVMPLLSALYQAAERQQSVVAWNLCCGLVNIALDLLLIPRLGAVGATLANGTAQLMSAIGLIFWAQRTLHIRWSITQSIPGLLAGLGAALTAFAAGLPFTHPPVRVGVGVVAAVLVYPVLIKLLRVLRPEDTPRIDSLVSRVLPGLRWKMGSSV